MTLPERVRVRVKGSTNVRGSTNVCLIPPQALGANKRSVVGDPGPSSVGGRGFNSRTLVAVTAGHAGLLFLHLIVLPQGNGKSLSLSLSLSLTKNLNVFSSHSEAKLYFWC